MHYPQGVLEAGMGCCRVNIVRECKLLYASKSLKCRSVYHLSFKFVELDKSVYRVPKFHALLPWRWSRIDSKVAKVFPLPISTNAAKLKETP